MNFLLFLFSIHPPPGLLPVLGPLTLYMTPTLDTALLMCGSPERGRATSSRAGADLGRASDSKLLVDSVQRASPLDPYEACSLSAYTPI